MQHMHGLQIWLAPPDAEQEGTPTFTHVAAEELPDWRWKARWAVPS